MGLLLLGSLLTGVRRDIPVEELLPQYAPQPSRFVELEGMRVHYRDEGSGPPLLLIHGTSSSLHTWDGWVRTLASHRRVLRLDLPGFGLTGPAPDADYSAERYARTVTAFLDHCGVAQADVAGNSLGGRVAVQLTLAYPARVRRLVLVDATGLAGQQPPAILGLARTPVLRELLTVVSPRFVVRQATEDVYGHAERVTEALVDRYHALLLREGNRRALVDRMSGSHDPDLDDRLCVIHDDVMSTLMETATEVRARIRLKEDTKTVAKGALWYEESLPTESILFGLVVASDARGHKATDLLAHLTSTTKSGNIQLGGKATVGRGVSALRILDGGAK